MKIAIIERIPVYRNGIKKMLNDAYKDLIFKEFDVLDILCEKTNLHGFDLLIIGINFENANSNHLIKTITASSKAPTLLLSTPIADQDVVAYIGAGAQGFLTRNTSNARLLEAVHCIVAMKNIYIERGYLNRIIGFALSGDTLSPATILTQRETAVAHYFARGEKTKVIGEKLNIKPATVRTIKTKVLSKLQIKNRYELNKVLKKDGEQLQFAGH